MINCGGALTYKPKLQEGKISETRARIRGELPRGPRGRPAKNLAVLLAAALNGTVTVTDWRATKMLIDMLRDLKKGGAQMR